MERLRILNTREIKDIDKKLSEQWGCSKRFDYVFLVSKDDNIFITNRDFGKIDTKILRINSVGLYFGELKNERLRLSIEGSQIVGPCAKKNVIELDDAQSMEWLKGNDVDKECEDCLAIIKTKFGFAGCGQAKQGKILNFVPKTRRIK